MCFWMVVRWDARLGCAGTMAANAWMTQPSGLLTMAHETRYHMPNLHGAIESVIS